MKLIRPKLLKDWRVLVVEDDPFNRDIATILLTAYGAEVHTAENGEHGLQVAQTVRPNFILSDISMPVMDGWMMIKALKADPRTKDIPVIALTAHAIMGYRERAIASGFHNFLTKPLTPQTFIHDLIVLLMDVPDLMTQLQDDH